MLATLRIYRFPAGFTALLLLLTSSLPLVQHVCAQATGAALPVLEECCCDRGSEHTGTRAHDQHSVMPLAHTGDAMPSEQHPAPCTDDAAPSPAHPATHLHDTCCSVEVQQADLEQVVPSPTVDLLTVPLFFFAGTPLFLPDETDQSWPSPPLSDHAPPVRTHLLLASLLN